MKGLPDPKEQNLIDDMPTRIAYALEVISDNIEFAITARTQLRDEFAKAAITGILAGKWGQLPQYKPEEAFADFAFRVADEMMKRRDRGNPD